MPNRRALPEPRGASFGHDAAVLLRVRGVFVLLDHVPVCRCYIWYVHVFAVDTRPTKDRVPEAGPVVRLRVETSLHPSLQRTPGASRVVHDHEDAL